MASKIKQGPRPRCHKCNRIMGEMTGPKDRKCHAGGFCERGNEADMRRLSAFWSLNFSWPKRDVFIAGCEHEADHARREALKEAARLVCSGCEGKPPKFAPKYHHEPKRWIHSSGYCSAPRIWDILTPSAKKP